MTAQFISGAAGVILSLACGYLPFVKTKFNALPGDYQRTVMGALLVLVTAGALLYQCKGFDQLCINANWQTFGVALFTALVANQTTYVAVVQGRSDRIAPAPLVTPVKPAP